MSAGNFSKSKKLTFGVMSSPKPHFLTLTGVKRCQEKKMGQHCPKIGLSKIRVHKRLNKTNRKSGVAAEYSCFLKKRKAGVKNELAFAQERTREGRKPEVFVNPQGIPKSKGLQLKNS